jgi:hypothetical protein
MHSMTPSLLNTKKCKHSAICMPKYMTVATHLTTEELEKHYRKARDGVDRSQWQIIWLVAQGKHSGEGMCSAG